MALVQDHVNPNLLFLATEYGVYISFNQGDKWHKFSNGLPTISVRDLAIQKRENDLVLATFGRSFYVLDDYSALRDISESSLEQEGILFQPRTGASIPAINRWHFQSRRLVFYLQKSRIRCTYSLLRKSRS